MRRSRSSTRALRRNDPEQRGFPRRMLLILLVLLSASAALPACQSSQPGWSWRTPIGSREAQIEEQARRAGLPQPVPGAQPRTSTALPEGVLIDGRRYLYGARFEPPMDRVLVGMGQWADGNAEYLRAVREPGLQPAAKLHFVPIGDWQRPWEGRLAVMASALQAEAALGRIPSVGISFSGMDPHTGREVAIDQELARGQPRYDERIADLARMLRDLRGPVFVRPGFEFNGDWNGYHPYDYPRAFRHVVAIFRREQADNVVFSWSYEPSAPDDFDVFDAAGWRWYPGDDVVDWFGLDLFDPSSFSGTLGRNALLSRAGRAERFLEMARARSKPVMLDEVSVVPFMITSDRLDGQRAWSGWFEPFFAFLERHPQIRGFFYINNDWHNSTREAANGWRDARITNNSWLLRRWQEELRQPKYLHLPDVGLLNGYADVAPDPAAPAPAPLPAAPSRRGAAGR